MDINDYPGGQLYELGKASSPQGGSKITFAFKFANLSAGLCGSLKMHDCAIWCVIEKGVAVDLKVSRSRCLILFRIVEEQQIEIARLLHDVPVHSE